MFHHSTIHADISLFVLPASQANQFHATGLFLYPLKISENQDIERHQWPEMG